MGLIKTVMAGNPFKTLHEGDRVTFEIGEGHKRPEAINVEKIQFNSPPVISKIDCTILP